ncbi:MAG: DUF6514 family protein [Oscillospiraceae bacterium]|nr:DUF6514 family protein [Oscillospiraceae bacterium]
MTMISYGEQTLPIQAKTKVRYSILVDEISFMNGQILCEYYGVQVDMDDESKQIRYITTNQEAILELLERLESGMVTPVTLYDVVSDWVEYA